MGPNVTTLVMEHLHEALVSEKKGRRAARLEQRIVAALGWSFRTGKWQRMLPWKLA